jgi:hypothetical protein
MTRKLDAAMNNLREAIFEVYHVLATEADRGQHLSEYQRRQSALRGIDEILEWRPLIQFSETHLELLELMFAYWRELEVEGSPQSPEPVGPEGLMSVWQGALPPAEPSPPLRPLSSPPAR